MLYIGDNAQSNACNVNKNNYHKQMRYGYASPARNDLSCRTQISCLNGAACDAIFVDEGLSRPARPELERLLASLRPGDAFVVTELARMASTIGKVFETLSSVRAAGASVVLIDEGIDSGINGHGDIFSHAKLFAACIQALGVERMLEGRSSAKNRGVKLGRKSKLNADQIEHGRKLLDLGESGTAVARTLGISVPTLYRHIKRD